MVRVYPSFPVTSELPRDSRPRWLSAGKFLLAGTKDGRVCMYNIEESVWDHRILPGSASDAAISSLFWTRAAVPPSPLPEFLRMPRCSPRVKLLALPAEGMPYTYPPMDGAAPEFEPEDALFRDAADFMQLLCTGNETGSLVLNIGGALPLGVIAVGDGGAAVTSVRASADWSMLACTTQDPASKAASFVVYDASVLASGKEKLHQVRGPLNFILNMKK